MQRLMSNGLRNKLRLQSLPYSHAALLGNANVPVMRSFSKKAAAKPTNNAEEENGMKVEEEYGTRL